MPVLEPTHLLKDTQVAYQRLSVYISGWVWVSGQQEPSSLLYNFHILMNFPTLTKR